MKNSIILYLACFICSHIQQTNAAAHHSPRIDEFYRVIIETDALQKALDALMHERIESNTAGTITRLFRRRTGAPRPTTLYAYRNKRLYLIASIEWQIPEDNKPIEHLRYVTMETWNRLQNTVSL